VIVFHFFLFNFAFGFLKKNENLKLKANKLMVNYGTFKYIWLCILILLTLTMRAQVKNTGKKADTPSATERMSPSSVSSLDDSKRQTGGGKKRSFEPVNQMVAIEKSGVDTLQLLDRIALRTNFVDWALMIPNFGAEFDVRNTNWNRWTVGFNVRYNWQTTHTYTNHWVYNIFEVRLEGRQYWRARQIGRRGLKPHEHIWDKAISIRRTKVKHPTTTWYRGAFLAYGKYSLLFGGNGHQGTTMMGGVTYGFVKPMFAFENGNSIDLDFGVSGGLMYYKDVVYTHDAKTDCYPVVEHKPGAVLPMVNEVRVGLVYRFGHVPVLAKYRYRRDVDIAYNYRKDSILDKHIHYRDSVSNYKATRETIMSKFWQVYDEVSKRNLERGIAPIISKPAPAPKDAVKPKEEKVKKADKPKDADKPKKEKKVKKAEARKEGSE
jgi:hypothetical protein